MLPSIFLEKEDEEEFKDEEQLSARNSTMGGIKFANVVSVDKVPSERSNLPTLSYQRCEAIEYSGSG